MVLLPEPRALTRDSAPVVDGELIRQDWENQPRYYLVRIYPVERGEFGQRRVMVHVTLQDDLPAFKFKHCDDQAAERRDAVIDCIGEIEADMDSTWDRRAVEELEDRRRVEARSYYR